MLILASTHAIKAIKIKIKVKLKIQKGKLKAKEKVSEAMDSDSIERKGRVEEANREVGGQGAQRG